MILETNQKKSDFRFFSQIISLKYKKQRKKIGFTKKEADYFRSLITIQAVKRYTATVCVMEVIVEYLLTAGLLHMLYTGLPLKSIRNLQLVQNTVAQTVLEPPRVIHCCYVS